MSDSVSHYKARENKSPEMLVACDGALKSTSCLVTALASLSIFGFVAMKWKDVKKRQQKQKADPLEDEQKQTA